MTPKDYVVKTLTFVVLFCAVSSIAVADDEFDFRNTRWGMTKSDVLKSEDGKPILEKNDLVVFKDSINGNNFELGYFFFENKLWRVVYFLASKHTNMNDYIVDYDSLKQLLAEKYGKAKEDKVLWKNNLYKNDPQNWGLAVSMGYLIKFSKWETTNSDISIFIGGENFTCRVLIEYESKKLAPLAYNAKKHNEKSKL